MKGSRQPEFKSDITNTFLKTVSAFANYDGGQIIFGISDSGVVTGFPDTAKICLEGMRTKSRKDLHPSWGLS